MMNEYDRLVIAGGSGYGTRFMSNIFLFAFNNIPLQPIHSVTGDAHSGETNIAFLPSDLTISKLLDFLNVYYKTTGRFFNLAGRTYPPYFPGDIHHYILYDDSHPLTKIDEEIISVMSRQIINESNLNNLYTWRTHNTNATAIEQICKQANINCYLFSILPTSYYEMAAANCFAKIKNHYDIYKNNVSFDDELSINNRTTPVIPTLSSNDLPFTIILEKNVHKLLDFILMTANNISKHIDINQYARIRDYIEEYFSKQLNITGRA